MAKAKVSLKDTGPRAYTEMGTGRHFEQGTSVVVTDPSEIARFQSDPAFNVEVLEAEPVKPAKRAPVEAETSEDEDPIEDDETELELTREAMEPMTKKKLVQAAKDRGIADIDDTMRKDDIIAKILLAQKE